MITNNAHAQMTIATLHCAANSDTIFPKVPILQMAVTREKPISLSSLTKRVLKNTLFKRVETTMGLMIKKKKKKKKQTNTALRLVRQQQTP
jgi:hypothetical protein